LTVKVVWVLPAGIVTVAATVAALEFVDRLITTPPVGAAPESVTVPVDEVRPVTLAGLKLTDTTPGGVTVNTAD
jgi:hypothetical protein